MIVILLSCDSPLAQWQPDDPGAPSGPLRWHNSACPGLCLTGLGNEQQVLALACDDSPSQRWWHHSREVSDRAWEPGDGRFRLRAWNRLYLDQFGEPGRDGTALTTRRRNDVNTQRWDMEYAGLGDNIVRLKGLGSGGRCVDILDTHGPRPSECSLLHDCTDRGVKDDGTGHRWQAEMYGDGSLRFRNEAAHLCLVPSAREAAYVTIESCSDDARQRWTIVP
ncbi:RICIN domain-containing protein [Streptomyces sp. NPDC093060]|uniref:RICIN domain-containing protein n=1 Tax=Streptomyces sp. NPDC093060 TaxID=3366019 RepID=UPI00382DF527